MKGILFCEFVEHLENVLGEDVAQLIINKTELKSDGAYTRVGFYDYQELISLLTTTANQTGLAAEDLLQGFADHLFMVFRRDYGVFFEGKTSAIEMLKTIDDHIHVEVRKLYPDAELPSFSYKEDGKQVTLNYQSPRPLASVAHALVSACLKSFDNEQTLLSYKIESDHKAAQFVIG